MIHNKFICSDYLIITFVQFVGFTAKLMTIKLERLPLLQECIDIRGSFTSEFRNAESQEILVGNREKN